MQANDMVLGKRYHVYAEFTGTYTGGDAVVEHFKDHDVEGYDAAIRFDAGISRNTITRVEEVLPPVSDLWPPRLDELWESPEGMRYYIREHTMRENNPVWSPTRAFGPSYYSEEYDAFTGEGWTPLFTER